MIESEIKFNIKGRILSGKYKSWFIIIENQSDINWGYTVYLTNGKDKNSTTISYDEWYYTFDELKSSFLKFYPDIDWNI